ncbi:MAG: 5-oxoprolinase subunit PxpA [Rhodospirillales bacterium]|nr:5-oxoprolinase subunit PxpA [Rhodospirillales bacterium]MSP79539.1 5-oxoprolinase subunit PxpA [Rhodospirillales bacterium]
MTRMINLNADMGEGFGAWDMGNDEALLGIVTSANVACGFHAGDPTVMHGLVTRAKKRGVSVGAHPGFNDIWGFGRRRIDMKPADLEYMIAYQIGALQGIAAYAGTRVTHVKPHGALYNMASENEDYALAIGRGIKTVDPKLIYVLLSGSVMEKAAEKLGLTYAREGFVDRLYEDDGNLTSRKIEGAVIRDPKLAAERVVRMVLDGELTSRQGKKIKCRVDSLCVHGDEPTAVAVATAARDALVAAGVRVVPLPEMNLG